MKVLLDEDVPEPLARYLIQHDTHTVDRMGWRGIKNGELLTLLERYHFDVFLTGDKNMRHQQRFAGRPFAILVMSAINWPVVEPHVAVIVQAVDSAQPGAVMLIECGAFRRQKRQS